MKQQQQQQQRARIHPVTAHLESDPNGICEASFVQLALLTQLKRAHNDVTFCDRDAVALKRDQQQSIQKHSAVRAAALDLVKEYYASVYSTRRSLIGGFCANSTPAGFCCYANTISFKRVATDEREKERESVQKKLNCREHKKNPPAPWHITVEVLIKFEHTKSSGNGIVCAWK